VVGWADPPAGSYAEYALANQIARIPTGLSFADAATLPTAGEAAKRGLDLLGVQAGETVVIHGASGSVGTIAVQLAVARGATVIGTASEENQDYVRSLGAIPMLYGEGLVDRVRASSRQVDAVFDVAGKAWVPRNSGVLEVLGGRVCMSEAGRLVGWVGTHRDTVAGWRPSIEGLLV
jgi:NADPH:quinone reductase-like Zn-dependent oxidoreductase